MSELAAEKQLAEIKQLVEETDRLPVPTLEIIGEEQLEAHWQSLLVYFLKGTNPHGFGTDVLTAFLKAIETEQGTTFERGLKDISQVTVQTEVSTGNGPVDMLLSLDDEWFICIELKVRSPETGEQTVRYANATTLGDIVVSEFDGTGEYLYLAPEAASTPSSDEFVEISWRNVVTHLEDVLTEGSGQYPAKSTAQLADYLDTIKRELNMTDTDGISTETELYIDHHDMIDRLKDNFETDKKNIFRDLREAFFANSDVNSKDWEVNNSPKNYINFYKESWYALESGTKFEFEPHLKLKTDNPSIRLRLDIEHGDKENIRQEFDNQLGEEKLHTLKEAGWQVTDSTYGYLAKSVSIEFENPQRSVKEAIEELHELRELVEPHIDTIAATHQSS